MFAARFVVSDSDDYKGGHWTKKTENKQLWITYEILHSWYEKWA